MELATMRHLHCKACPRGAVGDAHAWVASSLSASFCRVLVGTSALTAASLLTPLVAEANPEGGSVVGGQATISQAPGHTTIHQQSNRAIINWQGFDIDRSEVTSFIQPGSNSIALNRVDGNKPSLINGRLEANGHVWVVNPSGVVFGPTAQVDVHGVVATTSDILDSDFMNGNYAFSVPSPDPDAAVINQGNISIGEYGLAALVAPHARNDGMIVGTLGQIMLAGAPTFALDFQGDGLIQFAATSEVLSAVDPNHALVENTGTIRNNGGRVLLTAAAAAGVVNDVINTSGVIEARSVSQDRGEIVLHGGSDGIVAVSGQLNATGIDAGTVGGEIDVRGEKVLIAGGASIDASGHSGGGRVLVGGDPRGGGGDTAKQTIVAPGATLAADATSVGDGGDILVWADDGLVYGGSVSAGGGPGGGDGGMVETSSSGSLVFTGTVDTGAVAGEQGQWLLDPLIVRIVNGSGSHDVPVFGNDPAAGGQATVSVQSITQATGVVIIEATDSIRVEAPISTRNDIILRAKFVIVEASIESLGTVTIDAQNIKLRDGVVITSANLNTGSANVTSSPAIPQFSMAELNVVTDPVVISPADLGQSETAALAAPSPTVLSIPPVLDPAGSQDLLFSNDGNDELWGLSGL
jgi:trimeric autotransporter adhesin